MAIQVVTSTTYTAATETDLYTNTSGTLNALTLSISIYNGDSASRAVEIWRCDASNNHIQCLYNATTGVGVIVGDTSLYGIKPGEKIRFKVTGATSAVIISSTIYDGMT
jgi:hypothetical protein